MSELSGSVTENVTQIKEISLEIINQQVENMGELSDLDILYLTIFKNAFHSFYNYNKLSF